MLNELAKFLSGKKGERRASERRKVRYAISWLKGDQATPGVGMELSQTGLLFATKTAPQMPVFDVIMELRTKRIRARLLSVRTGTIQREGMSWTIVACTFSGIAADDYDALVRFLKDIPESENKHMKDLAMKKDQDDDAYRLLPLAVQRRVLDTLIRMRRLNEEAKNGDRAPMLRMTHLGMDGGRHRLNVHSRVTGGEEVESYNTVILIDESGNVKAES